MKLHLLLTPPPDQASVQAWDDDYRFYQKQADSKWLCILLAPRLTSRPSD
jgi:hypothetical protein